jgi:hypothetical protein
MVGMRARCIAIGIVGVAVFCGVLSGGEKKPPPVRSTENDLLEITVTPIADREAVQQALGSDLGGHYVLMEVHLAPKEGQKVAVHLDDFLLRTDKDGERTTPFVPSQIAGRGALVVTQSGGGGSSNHITLGPIMTGTSQVTENHSTMHSGSNDKPNPLLDVLKEKILPEKETEAPVSGLLYFPMEKQKVKDLELIYTTPLGKLSVRFK